MSVPVPFGAPMPCGACSSTTIRRKRCKFTVWHFDPSDGGMQKFDSGTVESALEEAQNNFEFDPG